MNCTLWRNWPRLFALSAVLILTMTLTSPAFGQATSITSTGFGANEKGNGTLALGYTTGNLGNTWSEGEWVAY
jgi:hypothetical protein